MMLTFVRVRRAAGHNNTTPHPKPLSGHWLCHVAPLPFETKRA